MLFCRAFRGSFFLVVPFVVRALCSCFGLVLFGRAFGGSFFLVVLFVVRSLGSCFLVRSLGVEFWGLMRVFFRCF